MAEVGFEPGGFFFFFFFFEKQSGGLIWVLIGGFKKHLLRFCVDLRFCVCEREWYPDCHY